MTEVMFERERRLLESYAKQEIELETKLKQLYNKYHTINFETKRRTSNNQNDKDAYQKRNELFLKGLEIATAKLRTQYFFCPTERCLEKAKKKYIDSVRNNFIQRESTKPSRSNETFL